jgi:hypothetical protein
MVGLLQANGGYAAGNGWSVEHFSDDPLQLLPG